MSLLKDLLSLRPALLICFIDGLQLLPHRNLTEVEARALGDVIQMPPEIKDASSGEKRGWLNGWTLQSGSLTLWVETYRISKMRVGKEQSILWKFEVEIDGIDQQSIPFKYKFRGDVRWT